MPALSVPLDRVTSQRIADKSKMVVGAVGRVKAKSIADSLGVWSLVGYDMTLSGVLDTGDGVQRISKLADLNKIVETVRSGSTFQRGILAEDPRPFGIAARLKIPKGAFVEGVVRTTARRTFVPGMHKQMLADFIRVRIPFKNAAVGPTLRLRRFGSRKSEPYKFTANDTDLTLTMSNLCKCVEPEDSPGAAPGMVIEDREFAVYYQLLDVPLHARLRPVPQVQPGIGGVFEPECYRGCRVEL